MDDTQNSSIEVTDQPTSLSLSNLTAADFETEVPYRWLYGQHLSKFELRRSLNMLIAIGVKLGVKKLTIQQYWNDFLADQKPVQSVGTNFVTEFPDQEKVLGDGKTLVTGKYQCDERGVNYFGNFGELVQVIPHPMMPTKRIVDVETNTENMQISYARMSKNEKGEAVVNWKSMITPRDTIASAQRIIALAKNGIAVNSENAKEVVKYLSDVENMNYPALDTQLSCSHMGWMPDGQFAPYTKKLVFGGESEEFARLYGGFHPEGSEQVWLDVVKKVRCGKSVPARIALAASFAAPLVSKLGALSFFVHLWGLQGTGKTVALILGASVWGNPQIGGYIKSFSGTKVSMELYSAFCGNLPVFLDELQVISDRKSFDDIIYSLCEGVSKGRGAKDGGLQTSKRWATVFLTTGEMPIVQSNSGGGAAVRTIEVNYGGEPFFEDARTVANTLKANYGWAGMKFIEALQEEGTMEALKKTQKNFYDKLASNIQDKQVLSASLLLAADQLADIAVFHDGKALTVEEIKPYLITQEQADINRRAYQYLVGWVAENQSHLSKDPEENRGAQWGILEEKAGKKYAFIIKNTFEKAMSEGGFPSGAFLSWAKRNNMLKTSRLDNNTIQKTIGGQYPTCVAVMMPGKEEENSILDVTDDAKKEENGFIDVSEEEELPF